MYQNEIIKIQNYIDTYLFIPPKNWPKYYVEERRYARWAVTEILLKLLQFENMSEIEALYNELPEVSDLIIGFIDELDDCTTIKSGYDYPYIFKVSRDSLYNLLCIFE